MPLLLVSTLSAQTDPAIAELLKAGAQTFQKSCAQGYCHGSEGRAARAPDIRNRTYQREQLLEIIANGIKGTTMPGFDGVLSLGDRRAVTAYVLSITNSATGSREPRLSVADSLEAIPTPQPTDQERYDAGRQLFSDLTRQLRCSLCHQVGGVGTPIGPELTASLAANGLEATRAWLQAPHQAPRVTLHLSSGDTFTGLLASRDPDQIQLWDLRHIPPVLRTFARGNISHTEEVEQPARAPHYNDAYSAAELDAILAYLATGPGR